MEFKSRNDELLESCDGKYAKFHGFHSASVWDVETMLSLELRFLQLDQYYNITQMLCLWIYDINCWALHKVLKELVMSW